MEREASLLFVMKIRIHRHRAGLSLSNTVSICEMFGDEWAWATVYNWIHKVERQPTDGHTPDHSAVEETVGRRNDERYWLYAAVDPATHEVLIQRLNHHETRSLLSHSCENAARNMGVMMQSVLSMFTTPTGGMQPTRPPIPL